jgi:FkbM family methyltransferase
MAVNLKIISHHVGGRDGSVAFPILSAFSEDIINVIYDADPDAIKQISERWQNVCDTRVFPYCLGEANRSEIFHINYDAYTSSLLPFNTAYAGYYAYHAPGKYDYVLGEACRTMEKRQVETVTLDCLIGLADFADLAPDFLALDTQGSELQILRGGKAVLRRHVLAVYCEAEFVPIYQGQGLVGDVQRFLNECDFDLADISLHEGFSSTRAPFGARGRGFRFGSDVLFLRRWQSVEAAAAGVGERWVMLHKLAFIAVVYGFIEYALEVMKAADGLVVPAAVADRASDFTYLAFLRRLREAVGSLRQQYPHTVGEKASFEELQARFRPDNPR